MYFLVLNSHTGHLSILNINKQGWSISLVPHHLQQRIVDLTVDLQLSTPVELRSQQLISTDQFNGSVQRNIATQTGRELRDQDEPREEERH